MIKSYETDYPFELANKGIALNLDSLFDGKSVISKLIQEAVEMD